MVNDHSFPPAEYKDAEETSDLRMEIMKLDVKTFYDP